MPTLNSCSVGAAGDLLLLSFDVPVTGVDAVEYAIDGQIAHALSAATPTGDDPGTDFVMTVDPPLFEGEVAVLAYYGPDTVDAQDPPVPLDTFSGRFVDNASTVPPPDFPPAAPTSLAAVGLAAVGLDARVRLTWNPNAEPDLATYTVYRSDALSGPYVAISTTGATSYVDDNGPVNGVWSYYRLSATDAGGHESALSDAVGAAPSAPAPTVAYPRLSLGLSEERDADARERAPV
jgi:hypothetical protein